MRTPEAIAHDAWRCVDELRTSGQCVLADGKTVVCGDDKDAKTLVDLLWKLATLHGKPKKAHKAMDDWKPKETKG